MSTIRTGIIGLGNRGQATLQRYMALAPRLTVVALADLNPDNIEQARHIMESAGACSVDTYSARNGWQRLAERSDLDLVVVCTDWQSHAKICSYAMQQGRHVAVEVPLATTIAHLRMLVETSRSTGRHCIMLENCCYDPFTLGTIEVVRSGALGEITHCQGAYIHDLTDGKAEGSYHNAWMSRFVDSHQGNPYPTHGLGPICRILDVCGGDTLNSIYSADTVVGGLNHSIITTRQGRTIILEFDITTPRPYNRRQTVCGTRGFIEKYPLPTLCLDGQTLTGDEAMQAVCSHISPEYKAIIAEGERLGVPNMMNYIMDVRMVEALTEGRDPDISIEEAALWSAIVQLSEQSAAVRQPVPIPQF